MGKYLLLLMIVIVGCDLNTLKAETFEYYVQRLEHHPSVVQIVEHSHRLKNLSSSANSLPDPQLIAAIDNIPLSDPAFNRFLPSAKVFGFKQAIPNPLVRKNNTRALLIESRMKRLVADYQLQQLRALFVRQLIEMKKIEALEEFLSEQMHLYRLLEKDLRGQLAAGHAVYGRFSEIDVQRVDIELQLNTLKAERVQIQETLWQLVEAVPQIMPPKVSPISWQRNDTPLYPVMIDQESVAVSKVKIDVAQAEFKPNYGVQALYKQRESGASFDGDDWFSVQATISIPLWSKSNQTPQLKAAKALNRSAQSAYEQSVRHWNQTMASLEAKIKFSRDNIDLLRQQKKSLKERIAAAERNYESGSEPLETVLGAQIQYLDMAAKIAVQENLYDSFVVEFNSHIHNTMRTEGDAHVVN